MLVKHKFKRIRIIEWKKTNPIAFQHNEGYLFTNCKEYALVAGKGTNPTFNSSHDYGNYECGLQNGKKRFHPCKKPDKLFIELINKHSNEGDTVMDTFLGGGTTAFACKNTNRKFVGCELDRDYYLKFWEQYDKKKYDFYMQVLKDEPDWLKEHKYDYQI